MKNTVHIIPHTHWDKEWYFTSSRSKIYLVRQVQEIMNVLTNNPKFRSFLLDGQSSLIEEYLTYYPEDKDLIQSFIRNKRLTIGPWYTQTDQLVVSQESVVRNLYYGIKFAKNMGHSMMVGYCPDVFGQGGNMPQIYKHSAIDYFLFWRGIADDWLDTLEFNWQGSDGTEILSNQMYYGYYYGTNIPKNGQVLPDYVEKVIAPLEKRALTPHLYFPNGGDQVPIQKDLTEVVENLNKNDSSRNYIISTPEEFFEGIEKSEVHLPVVKGEMLEGKNSRVHKSIYSTRADLKQANNRIENKLVNIAEPLLTISHSLGNKYPHREIEETWKLMFNNAAHDSIGGCNSDSTNQDIAARYKTAEDTVDNLIDLHMREISMNIQQEELYAFTIFNTLPYKRSSVLETKMYIPDGEFKIVDGNDNELEYVVIEKEDQSDYLLNQFSYLTPHLYSDELDGKYIPDKVYYAKVKLYVNTIPAMGYSQLYLLPGKKALCKGKNESSATNSIDNSWYKIDFNTGSNNFTVYNKLNGRKYEKQFVLVENGDDGDSYNYSPPVHDSVIDSSQAEIISRIVEKSNVEEVIKVVYEMKVPSNLEQREKNVMDSSITIDMCVSLRKDEKLARVSIDTDNKVMDHRLCVKSDSYIEADYSIADKLFGVEKSSIKHPLYDTWKQENWAEAPIAINPMQSFVALTDNESTVSLMTEGVREYEIVGDHHSEIQLTLFRGFGYMGKEDLQYRPGRASGEKIVATPDAQLLKPLHFEFAAIYEEDNFEEVAIAKTAKEYLTPFYYYELTDFLNGRTIFPKNNVENKKLSTDYSLLQLEGITAIMSTLKKAEDSNHYVIRLFNPFVSKVVDVGKNPVNSFVPVELDEMTQMKQCSELKHNQFQTFVGG